MYAIRLLTWKVLRRKNKGCKTQELMRLNALPDANFLDDGSLESLGILYTIPKIAAYEFSSQRNFRSMFVDNVATATCQRRLFNLLDASGYCWIRMKSSEIEINSVETDTV